MNFKEFGFYFRKIMNIIGMFSQCLLLALGGITILIIALIYTHPDLVFFLRKPPDNSKLEYGMTNITNNESIANFKENKSYPTTIKELFDSQNSAFSEQSRINGNLILMLNDIEYELCDIKFEYDRQSAGWRQCQKEISNRFQSDFH